MKKFIALLLAAMLVLSSMVALADGAEGEEVTVTEEEEVTAVEEEEEVEGETEEEETEAETEEEEEVEGETEETEPAEVTSPGLVPVITPVGIVICTPIEQYPTLIGYRPQNPELRQKVEGKGIAEQIVILPGEWEEGDVELNFLFPDYSFTEEDNVVVVLTIGENDYELESKVEEDGSVTVKILEAQMEELVEEGMGLLTFFSDLVPVEEAEVEEEEEEAEEEEAEEETEEVEETEGEVTEEEETEEVEAEVEETEEVEAEEEESEEKTEE